MHGGNGWHGHVGGQGGHAGVQRVCSELLASCIALLEVQQVQLRVQGTWPLRLHCMVQ
jgi:hypothetical protein